MPGDQHPITVTCVVPTHQRDESMLAAVASIHAQTVPATRIVVVDDTGGDPGRPAVLSIRSKGTEYADASGSPRPGASASRNRGARDAGTDLLAFLDDDDLWDPTFLESVLSHFEDEETDLVVTWGRLVRDGRTFPGNWSARPGLTAREVVARNPGLTGSNFIVRRDVFERLGGFDPAMTVWNDLDFFVRFLEAGGRYRVVEIDLVTQNITPGAHLSSRSERRAQGIERYLRKHADLLERSERRRILRSGHVARLHREQSPGRYLRSLLAAVFFSTPGDWAESLRRRLQRSTYN